MNITLERVAELLARNPEAKVSLECREVGGSRTVHIRIDLGEGRGRQFALGVDRDHLQFHKAGAEFSNAFMKIWRELGLPEPPL